MKKHKEERFGEVIMIIEVVLHAIWPVAAHYGASQMPQLQFLAAIFLISAVCFTATTLWRKEFHVFFNARIFAWLVIYSLPFMMLPYGIIVFATRYSDAINTTMLTQSEAIFAAIFGALILKESVSINKGLGIFFILLANVAILYSGSLSFSPSNLALVLAPALFVFGNMIAKKLQREGVGWSPLLMFRNWLGGLVLLGTTFLLGGVDPISSQLWWFIFVVAVGLFVFNKILWQVSLVRLDVSKLTALGCTYPFVSVLVAYLWLGETPGPYQWLGILLTGVGVLFLLNTRSKQWVEMD